MSCANGFCDAGKGSTYRPINRKVYEQNYDDIFRKADGAGSEPARLVAITDRTNGPRGDEASAVGSGTGAEGAGPEQA
jgi:hypothetical protein